MSSSGAGITGKSQLPIGIGNAIGPCASRALRGDLPVVSSAAQRPPTVSDPRIGSPRMAVPAAFAGAFFGCLATLHLSAFGVVPVIASALVTTLLGGQILVVRSTNPLTRALVPAIYGGGFGGMTSLLWLSSTTSDHPILSVVPLFISLSIVCGLAFGAVAIFDAYATRQLTKGYGGRSGVIATIACVFFVRLAALCGADDRPFHTLHMDLASVNPGSLALLMAACLTGTGVTMQVLRRERVAAADLADQTFVASAIALLGLLVVHRVSRADAGLLEAYYAGCFLGMSSRERLNGWMDTALGAILLTGLIIQIKIFLPGIGGGLGLAAFATVAVLVTLKQFMRFVLPLNRSQKMTTQLPIVRGRSADRVPYPIKKPKAFGGDVSLRPATVIASFALAAALIVGLIWPSQFTPKMTVAVSHAPVSANDTTTPDPVVPQAEARTSAIDGMPPGGAVVAELRSESIPPSDNTTSDNAPSAKPSEISADNLAGLRLTSAAPDEQAVDVEAPQTAGASGTRAMTTEPNTSVPNATGAKTTELMSTVPTMAPPVVSGVAATREAALGETQKNDDSIARDALFREFLKWRDARVSAVSPSARPTAAKSHYHLLPPSVVPTTAATNRQPRSTHLLSATQTTPVTSAVSSARRPHQGNTTEQVESTSATFGARPF
jgi:hypothetical protein